MNRSMVLILGLSITAFSSALLAQSPYSSGSTGAQGPFPPAALLAVTDNGNGVIYTIDLKTGVATATGFSGTASVTLPGAATSGDAFPSGDLDFTTFSVP